VTLKRYALLSTIIAMLLVVAAFRFGQATTSVTFDSAWWHDLSPSDRLSAVQGALSAYGSGYSQGSADGSADTRVSESEFSFSLLTRYFTGDRAKYLTGFMAFESSAIKSGLWDMLQKQADATADAKAKANPIFAGVPNFSKTFRTYADGVTHFYENNPTKAGTVFGYIIGCMSDTSNSFCKKNQ
jgi:hypothetical protein